MEEHKEGCEGCGPECHCGHDHEDYEEMAPEELLEDVDAKVDAVINLLIKKGVFSEDEFHKECEDLFEESDEDDGEEDGILQGFRRAQGLGFPASID